MTDRQEWLLKQPTFWLGVMFTVLTALMACGVIPAGGVGSRVVAAVLSVLNQYGITAAHLANPPREEWSEQRKIDESLARIARGEPPLHGYEYLIRPAVSVPPPLPPVDVPGTHTDGKGV